MNKWSKNSWREFSITQQPEWSDLKQYNEVVSKLNKLPSLVFSGETRKLREQLIDISRGNAFILMIGNCAESFDDCHGPKIHNYLRIFLQMAMVMQYKTQKKIIKIGRIAGQYAKPRTSNFEIIDGNKILSYRGDNINEIDFTLNTRLHKPEKLLEGYFRSAATLNLIRAFIQGGYNDISNIKDWEEHFFSRDIAELDYYRKFSNDVSNSLKNSVQGIIKDNIYISHECLLLDYEEIFTRLDTVHGGYYDTSAHFLWVGDRTRYLNGAHIEYIRGIGNPVGIKIGPNYDLEEILKIIKKVNPNNEIDRLILISRMGAKQIVNKLTPLLKLIKDEGLNVIFMCDPMHGNTFNHGKYKVRNFIDIVNELKSFFLTCIEEQITPGGIHLETTDDNVTECIGGLNGLTLSDVSKNYDAKVDPRLNAAQALEIAFIVSELINSKI